MKTDRRENVKLIVTNYIIKATYPNMFFSGLSSVISIVFDDDFEHVFFFCWKKYSKSTIVAVILKDFAQQTNTYSKSAAETLRANSKKCASLLTTCSMSKTLFERFAATIFCSMYLLSILNVFHSFIYFYLLSVLY